jgi:hypothetical protein
MQERCEVPINKLSEAAATNPLFIGYPVLSAVTQQKEEIVNKRREKLSTHDHKPISRP